jgi:hypothetical protein
VVAVRPEERLGLDTFITDSVKSRKREFVFRCNIAGLLSGDLTHDSIERQALQLLRGLIYFRQHDDQLTTPLENNIHMHDG